MAQYNRPRELEAARLANEKQNFDAAMLLHQNQADYVFDLLMHKNALRSEVSAQLPLLLASIERLETQRVHSKYTPQQLRRRLKEIEGYARAKKEPRVLGWVAALLLALRVALLKDKNK